MSDFRIVFVNEEGGLSIVVPAPGATQADAMKAVPPDAEFKVVDKSEIPEDRTFRDAWEKQGAGIGHNMDKAKAIKLDQVRAERAPMLAALDVEFMRAVEAGDTAKQAEIAAKKQALRDATKDPAILNAESVEELKAATPAALRG